MVLLCSLSDCKQPEAASLFDVGVGGLGEGAHQLLHQPLQVRPRDPLDRFEVFLKINVRVQYTKLCWDTHENSLEK